MKILATCLFASSFVFSCQLDEPYDDSDLDESMADFMDTKIGEKCDVLNYCGEGLKCVTNYFNSPTRSTFSSEKQEIPQSLCQPKDIAETLSFLHKNDGLPPESSLRGAYLVDADMRGKNLSQVDFTRAALGIVDDLWDGANISGSTLKPTYIREDWTNLKRDKYRFPDELLFEEFSGEIGCDENTWIGVVFNRDSSLWGAKYTCEEGKVVQTEVYRCPDGFSYDGQYCRE